MTTAARPTWAPAKGSDEQGGARMFGPSQHYSSRDLASHTKLKTRKSGQTTKDDLKKRDLKEELEEKERRHFSSRDKESDDRGRGTSGGIAGLLEGSGTRRDAEERFVPRAADADDSDGDGGGGEGSDGDDDDDDEDDTAALLAELDRIKKERAEEKMRKEKQKQEEEAKAKEVEMARGNPLLGTSASFTVKRRWDDDVVFRNQTKGETKAPKRFINDTIRSDFHRRFLNKYMK